MPSATATFLAFDHHAPSRGVARRGALGRIAISLGTVAAVCVTATLAAAAVAWIVVAAFSVYPSRHTRALVGLDAAALTSPYRALADGAYLGGSDRTLPRPGDVADLMREAEVQVVVATASVPTIVALRQEPTPEITQSVPPPPPFDAPHPPATQQDIARRPVVPAAPQVATAASPPPSSPQKPSISRQAHTDSNSPSDLDRRTAVYDIEAHTVYLPNGAKLEAHSGLGEKLDNPRYVNVKDRGPTPPNVYDLTLREQIFHGVRAIRLNPVDDSKTFGRDGMLAHTYMLGPSGQSFGCVSFKDYPAFLQAFLKGEVDRLVVVPHGGTSVLRIALAGRGQVATLEDGR